MSEETIIIANWKIALGGKESGELAEQLKKGLRRLPDGKEVIVCPSFMWLQKVSEILAKTDIKTGAQDCFWEERGAYTGNVSPLDLKESGCHYVILGHSERRKYLSETNLMVHQKARVVLNNGMTPIICVGEDFDQRQGSQKDYAIIRQLSESLEGINVATDNKIIVAYEPVWAISTSGGGIKPEPEEVSYSADVIRHILLDLYGNEIVNTCFRIIYGGSVNSSCVADYTKLPNICGVLVGSASLKIEEFVEIINNA